MKVTDADLRQALGHRRPRGREGCPSTEAIVAHAEGSGTPEVLEHVSRCDACAVEYRLALSLKPWAEGAASALGGASPAIAPVRPRSTWWPQALAASLLVSVGLGAWNVALRGQRLDLQARLAETQSRAPVRPDVVTANQPAVNVPIVDLDAGGSRGPGAAPAVVRIASGTPLVTFVLTVSGGASSAAHALQIRSEDGRVVWEGGGLVANAFGTFTLAVPATLLPAGRYDFVLSRATRPVQTYRLVVQPPAP